MSGRPEDYGTHMEVRQLEKSVLSSTEQVLRMWSQLRVSDTLTCRDFSLQMPGKFECPLRTPILTTVSKTLVFYSEF